MKNFFIIIQKRIEKILCIGHHFKTYITVCEDITINVSLIDDLKVPSLQILKQRRDAVLIIQTFSLFS